MVAVLLLSWVNLNNKSTLWLHNTWCINNLETYLSKDIELVCVKLLQSNLFQILLFKFPFLVIGHFLHTKTEAHSTHFHTLQTTHVSQSVWCLPHHSSKHQCTSLHPFSHSLVGQKNYRHTQWYFSLWRISCMCATEYDQRIWKFNHYQITRRKTII